MTMAPEDAQAPRLVAADSVVQQAPSQLDSMEIQPKLLGMVTASLTYEHAG